MRPAPPCQGTAAACHPTSDPSLRPPACGVFPTTAPCTGEAGASLASWGQSMALRRPQGPRRKVAGSRLDLQGPGWRTECSWSRRKPEAGDHLRGRWHLQGLVLWAQQGEEGHSKALGAHTVNTYHKHCHGGPGPSCSALIVSMPLLCAQSVLNNCCQVSAYARLLPRQVGRWNAISQAGKHRVVPHFEDPGKLVVGVTPQAGGLRLGSEIE